jgi:hypothetical protein
MPLVLALKNQKSVVVASDTDGTPMAADRFGQFMPLPNRTALLLVGNLAAVKHAVVETVMPKITSSLSTAGLAQLIQAALVLELVPHLAELKGRIEIIVAGIDPVRHIEEPNLYYMDSAQDFYLKVVDAGYALAGSTATAGPLLLGRDYNELSNQHLKDLAKECYATTKLRWPEAVASHIEIATISSQNTMIENY